MFKPAHSLLGGFGRRGGRAQAQGDWDPLPPAVLRPRQLQKQPLPQLPALLLRGPDDVQHGVALQSPGGSCPLHTQTPTLGGQTEVPFRERQPHPTKRATGVGSPAAPPLLGKHPRPPLSVTPWVRLLLGLQERVSPRPGHPPPPPQAGRSSPTMPGDARWLQGPLSPAYHSPNSTPLTPSHPPSEESKHLRPVFQSRRTSHKWIS